MSTWRPIPPQALWKRLLPSWLHLPVVIAAWFALAGGVALVVLVLFYARLAARYDMDEVARLPEGTVFLDREGRELPGAALGGRPLVGREELPDFLVEALRAREDARFFEHGGVDLRGLARAMYRNLRDRRFTQGASTLSMQLARNTYDIRAKSLHRKFLEIAITWRVEARYDKDEILTLYLNRIYFGAGAYGIEQASRTYFGKSVADLHPGECAMLVGIIRGPHVFSPLRDFDAALRQRDQTLARMLAEGWIDAAEHEWVANLPIELVEEPPRDLQRSYVQRVLRRELDRVLGPEDILRSGLRVTTTLDLAWQSRLEAELERALVGLEAEAGWPHPSRADHVAGEEPGYLQFAAVTTATRSGEVLAWVGGRDFEHSRFDRTRSRRDLGPVFEPFVAAAAAERGKLVLAGRPVQTGRQIGHAEVERLVRRVGISGPFLKSEDLFRGGVVSSPSELSIALATIGNQGKRPRPYLIREVRDAAGNLLYEAQPRFDPALGSQAAEEALRLLRRHAGTRCFTGVTPSERDAWMLRLGPSGSTAIWIGFDQPTPIAPGERLKSLVDEFVQRLGND